MNTETWEIIKYSSSCSCEHLGRNCKCHHHDNATKHCCYSECPIKKIKNTDNFNFDKCYGF